ncbi:MAG: hypothetical protein E6Q98_21245 [Rhodospirillaceae bacterium]|nr:MAG: hypothetical protein E6Q98_21245 [Rhodospirillaceae bacterium]
MKRASLTHPGAISSHSDLWLQPSGPLSVASEDGKKAVSHEFLKKITILFFSAGQFRMTRLKTAPPDGGR